MMSASTISYRQDAMDSQYLSSSLSNMSRSRSANALIVRAYKQATQLYLTKRFKESLETLEPVITPQRGPTAGGGLLGNGFGGDASTEDDDDEEEYNNNSSSDDNSSAAAPIAQSSRGTRTKVWVFYLSLLHAIIELGPEDGKAAFGAGRWRALAGKARTGSVWEEVVRRGYGGSEGEVDAEVVVNLATLLLGHMAEQRLTQARLEAYLSAAPDDAALLMLQQDGIATPMSTGTSSPKQLTTRLKILELFTLHVLPANEEWEYAEQFIEMNELLDDERREAFLHALQSVRDEKEALAQREEELREMRARELEEQRAAQELRQREEQRREEERQRAAEVEKQRLAAGSGGGGGGRGGGGIDSTGNGNFGGDGSGQSASQPHSRPISSHANATGSRVGTGSGAGKPSASSAASSASSKTPTKPPANANLLARASFAFNNLQHMITQASRNVSGNNIASMRLLVFAIALLILMARRDLRDRLKRALNDSWIKVKQTVGMGVKVSYI